MKKIMLFEQFINETWKTDMSQYDWMEPILKKNSRKRFNDEVLNDRELLRDRNMSGNDAIAYIYGDPLVDGHVSAETDDLYYPLLDPKKLNATKQWILQCWEIFTKDFIEKIDNYKGANLEFDSSNHYIESEDFQSLVTDGASQPYGYAKEETSATKKYAKQLPETRRPNAYKMLCNDFAQTIVACYGASKERKEMESFCDLWALELEKRLNTIIKAMLEISDSRAKHHNKFAKEIGHVKGKHKKVRVDVIPRDPKTDSIQSRFDGMLGVSRLSDAIGYDPYNASDERPKAPGAIELYKR